MNYYIYKITSPSNNVYIGITNNLTERELKHKTNAVSTEARLLKRKIVQAYIKYGKDNMNFEHIATAFSHEDAKVLEIELIETHNSYHRGYNGTLGGDRATFKYLAPEDLESIRNQLETTTDSLQVIGDRFNLSSATIMHIQRNHLHSETGNARVIERPGNTFAHGSSAPNVKLTEDQVYEIKRLSTEGLNSVQLSSKFGVTKTNICDILTEKIWKHVKFKGMTRPKHRGNSKLTEVQVREAWELKLKETPTRTICDITGIKYHTLYACFTGKNWKDLYEEYSG